jgi:hypothetical protein
MIARRFGPIFVTPVTFSARRGRILPRVHPGRALSARLNNYQGQAEAIEETATQMPHQNPAEISMAMPQPATGLSGTLVS